MNDWNELQTSKLFKMVFTKKTPIKSIFIEKIEFYNSLSSLRIDFDLVNILPDTPLEKWKAAGYNRCRMGLDCNNIEKINIIGEIKSDIYNIKIDFEEKYILEIKNDTLNIQLQAEYISLCGPSMYMV
jgi:hypothetical protein